MEFENFFRKNIILDVKQQRIRTYKSNSSNLQKIISALDDHVETYNCLS